jgi:hypothetical protein
MSAHLGSTGDINWFAWLVELAWVGAMSMGCRDCDGDTMGTLESWWLDSWVVALSFGVKALLEAVHTLQQGFEHIRLGPSLLWHGVCGRTSAQVLERRSTSEHTVNTRAVEDLAGFACWAGAVALDLEIGR